jgi:hypothetical protein
MAVIAFSSPSSDDVRIWKMGQTRRRKNVENVFVANRPLCGQFILGLIKQDNSKDASKR